MHNEYNECIRQKLMWNVKEKKRGEVAGMTPATYHVHSPSINLATPKRPILCVKDVFTHCTASQKQLFIYLFFGAVTLQGSYCLRGSGADCCLPIFLFFIRGSNFCVRRLFSVLFNFVRKKIC